MPRSAEDKAKHTAYMREYLRRKCAEDPSFKARLKARALVNERKRRASRSPEAREAINAKKRATAKLKRATDSEGWSLERARSIAGWSRRKGVPCNITAEDIPVPKACPVLGVVLVFGGIAHAPNAPSVDRVAPHLGYTKGNVRVISYRANFLKSNATLEEHRLVYEDSLRLSSRP